MKLSLRAFLLLYLLGCVCSTSYAASYTFSTLYNGNSTVLMSGSDNPIGMDLAVEDKFNYNLSANADDFWQVDSGGFFISILAFETPDDGSRYSDFTLSFLLDSVVQYTHSETNSLQSWNHIGTNGLTLSTGLQFDELLLKYTLNSSDSDSNTISDYYWNGLSPDAFPGISYIYKQSGAPTPVPEPATLLILGSGIIGLIGIIRKNKKTTLSNMRHCC